MIHNQVGGAGSYTATVFFLKFRLEICQAYCILSNSRRDPILSADNTADSVRFWKFSLERGEWVRGASALNVRFHFAATLRFSAVAGKSHLPCRKLEWILQSREPDGPNVSAK